MYNLNKLKKIFSLLDRNEKLKLSVVFLIYLLNIFFDLLGIGMIIPIINVIMGNSFVFFIEIPIINSFFSNNSQSTLLFYSMLFFLLFYIFKTFYATFAIWYQKKFIFFTSKNFSKRLLEKYLNIKYLDFLSRNQSDLVRNIVFESSIFVTSILQSLIELIVEIILIFGIGFLLIFYNPESSIILMSIIFVLGLSYIFYFRKKLNFLGKERQLITSKLLKVLTESFILQKEVRILQKEDFIINSFEQKANKIAKISVFEQIINVLPKVWFEFVAVLGLTSVVFYFVIFGIEIDLLVPLLALYAAAIFRLLPSVNRIIGASNNIIHNLPAFDVISEELLQSNKFFKIIKNKKYEKFDNFVFEKFNPKKLSLKNITFSYNKKKDLNLFKNISLEFNQGEITGIVGKSGSGKSTLANIISGLIDDYEGDIEINNNSKFNMNILRRSVGYVPQITNLLDDSIKNNICFGIIDQKIDENKLKKIIDEVELASLIESLENGLDTIIGDQGLTLSGGQRQKIALARTLYLDPKIIIFDESTNSLDKLTEKAFFNNILSLKKNKIIICITHDEVLSEFFDKIYNLSDKTIK